MQGADEPAEIQGKALHLTANLFAVAFGVAGLAQVPTHRRDGGSTKTPGRPCPTNWLDLDPASRHVRTSSRSLPSADSTRAAQPLDAHFGNDPARNICRPRRRDQCLPPRFAV